MDAKTEIKLLPCPFCGKDGILDVHDDESRIVEFVVTRCTCGVNKQHRDEPSAVAWWNRRTQPAGEVERKSSKLYAATNKVECCSAVSPCTHQQRFPGTVCETCYRACSPEQRAK